MGDKPVDTAITMVVGPCIDDTDFKSLEEAIAYNAAGMDISLIVEKTDGTTAVTAITLTTGGTSDWTHKDGGYYEVEITAAQNIEEGVGYVRGVCTGVLPFESAHYSIVKANIYDSLIKGTDVLHADVTQLAGVTQSLTDLKDFADAGYDPATNKITGCKVNDDMVGTANAALAATALSDATWTDAKAMFLDHSISTVDTVADGIQTDLSNATDGLGALKALLDAIPTTAMRGTDGANTTVPDAAGVAPTAAEIKTSLEQAGSSIAQILEDTGTTLDVMITRILGLNQENFYIDMAVFSSGNMTGCRIRTYSVAGSVGTASDVLATYTMTATYSGNDMSSYKLVKV